MTECDVTLRQLLVQIPQGNGAARVSVHTTVYARMYVNMCVCTYVNPVCDSTTDQNHQKVNVNVNVCTRLTHVPRAGAASTTSVCGRIVYNTIYYTIVYNTIYNDPPMQYVHAVHNNGCAFRH